MSILLIIADSILASKLATVLLSYCIKFLEMAEVYNYSRSDNISSETGCEDLGDIESEQSMDSTDDPGLVGVFYDDEKVAELEKKISTLTQQLQELQSRSEQQKEFLENERDNLSQDVKELKSEIDDLQRQLKEKHKKVEELEARVQELEAQVYELNRKMKSYECDQDRLYLCQVAVEFERALCSHVIPEVFSRNKRTSSANLDCLLNMLNSGDLGLIPLSPAKYNIKAILSSARQRWEKVCEDLQLPPEWKTITGKEVNFSHASVPPIFRAMALLKEKRNPVAHPTPVSLQVAEHKIKVTSIQDEMEEWEFDLVRDFISSLRTSIRKSGIQTSQNRFEL